MKTNQLLRFLLLIIFFCFSSCESNQTIENEQLGQLDPAFEDLLVSINHYEQENRFLTNPPTRRPNWGWVVACDAVPMIILGGNKDTFIGGVVLGVLWSLWVAIFDSFGEEMIIPDLQNQFAEMQVLMSEIDGMLKVGAVHNLALTQLIMKMDEVDYANMSDWELFNMVEQEVQKYLPEVPIDFSQNQFKHMVKSIPDSRVYLDRESLESACFAMHPELEGELTIASKVLSTILAQDTVEATESYEQGVIQLINTSSIPNESKQSLISSISIQKSSKEFWYE